MADIVNICHKRTRARRQGCPQNCPCEPPKQGLQSQRQPNRSIGELVETVGFVRRIDDCREAAVRLANRRLQPLGHLTARES